MYYGDGGQSRCRSAAKLSVIPQQLNWRLPVQSPVQRMMPVHDHQRMMVITLYLLREQQRKWWKILSSLEMFRQEQMEMFKEELS